MVKPWDLAVAKGIELTKYRIKHHEKHGNGQPAMQDKDCLKKQERALILRKENQKK